MRSDGKYIYEKDIEAISYTELLNYKYDFRVEFKNGKEIKIKRKLGIELLKLQNEVKK